MVKPKVTIGGIIKYNGGIGFKCVFQDKEQANKYKDMIRWILNNDGYHIEDKKGYHDDKEMK